MTVCVMPAPPVICRITRPLASFTSAHDVPLNVSTSSVLARRCGRRRDGRGAVAAGAAVGGGRCPGRAAVSRRRGGGFTASLRRAVPLRLGSRASSSHPAAVGQGCRRRPVADAGSGRRTLPRVRAALAALTRARPSLAHVFVVARRADDGDEQQRQQPARDRRFRDALDRNLAHRASRGGRASGARAPARSRRRAAAPARASGSSWTSRA